MNELRDDSSRWIAFGRPAPGARLRLFCFPYAGGSAVIFRDWAPRLPREIALLPVELPGRGRRVRERAHDAIGPLVHATADALAEHLDVPYAFFGHSMGAILAFELSRELRRRGLRAPLHLYVSGCPAPEQIKIEPRTFDLPRDEFIAELRRLDGTPAEIFDHPELLDLFEPLLRADFAVTETYTLAPDDPLATPISAFGGLGDAEVSREALEAWGGHTASRFRVRMLEGGHFFIHSERERFLGLLDEELRRLLARIAGDQ